MDEQKFELDLRMSEKGIICNAEKLKAMLPEKLKPYNYVVTVNNYKDAKTDRTKLNNLYDVLQAKRKQFEEVELADWKSYKQILMETEKMIKAVSDSLGQGIKDIDENEKLAKMEEVRQSYNIVAQNIPLTISFNLLYDRKKYDTKAMTVKKIEEDITDKVKKIITDWNMLEVYLPSDPVDLEQVKNIFETTLDVGLAKSKADDLKAMRERVEQTNIETHEDVKKPVEELKNNDLNTSSQLSEKKQRIVVEFVSTRPFFDAMNQLILKHKPQFNILKKEDI